MAGKGRKWVDFENVYRSLAIGFAALIGWFALGLLLMPDQLAVWLAAGIGAEVLAFSVCDLIPGSRNAESGAEGSPSILPSETGRVTTALNPTGKVRLGSELWNARSSTGDPIAVGTEVEVGSRDGLTLMVEVSLDEKLRRGGKLAS